MLAFFSNRCRHFTAGNARLVRCCKLSFPPLLLLKNVYMLSYPFLVEGATALDVLIDSWTYKAFAARTLDNTVEVELRQRRRQESVAGPEKVNSFFLMFMVSVSFLLAHNLLVD